MWMRSKKVKLLAEKARITKEKLCHMAFHYLKARNGAVLYHIMISFCEAVAEARLFGAADEIFFRASIPYEMWWVDSYEIIAQVF